VLIRSDDRDCRAAAKSGRDLRRDRIERAAVERQGGAAGDLPAAARGIAQTSPGKPDTAPLAKPFAPGLVNRANPIGRQRSRFMQNVHG
jgi:hypothetical protein